MKKGFVLAVFAYLVPTFILGASWHFLFFRELYDSFGIYNRPDPIIPMGFGSMVIQGLILAYLYPFYFHSGSPIRRGFQFGVIMGLFLFSVSTIANTAKIQVSNTGLWFAVQAAFHFIQFGVTGPLIGLVYRNLRNSPA
ncbi:MAG: DUF1761 domain-containing protein [Leptospirales bacterium]|nr:DUF1761 domain-containing protein [Leptospirales bacterium]